MNYRLFATEYPEVFKEAYSDISKAEVGALLDAMNFEALGKLIWENIEAAKETVEADFPPEPLGDLEAYREHLDLTQ